MCPGWGCALQNNLPTINQCHRNPASSRTPQHEWFLIWINSASYWFCCLLAAVQIPQQFSRIHWHVWRTLRKSSFSDSNDGDKLSFGGSVGRIVDWKNIDYAAAVAFVISLPMGIRMRIIMLTAKHSTIRQRFEILMTHDGGWWRQRRRWWCWVSLGQMAFVLSACLFVKKNVFLDPINLGARERDACAYIYIYIYLYLK